MRSPSFRVGLVDGAQSPGAKILVSGGGRCNVTNGSSRERDYWGGPPASSVASLRALPVQETVRFFAAAGVALHEEHDGKLFPDSNSARHVLDALLQQAAAHGVERVGRTASRRLHQDDGGFVATTPAGEVTARRRRSRDRRPIPAEERQRRRRASDSPGARAHNRADHTSTVAHRRWSDAAGRAGCADALRSSRASRSTPRSRCGWMAGPGFGCAGRCSGRISASAARWRSTCRGTGCARRWSGGPRRDRELCRRPDYDGVDRLWLDRARGSTADDDRQRRRRLVPASVAAALLQRLSLDRGRYARRAPPRRPPPPDGCAHRVAAGDDRLARLQLRGSHRRRRDLREIDPATMESRRCPGLYLVGEILDVDGRLGGFNFQWAWSSAAAAALRPR